MARRGPSSQTTQEVQLRRCLITYDPLQVLKLVAPDVWVIDGPEIRMRYAGLTFPFTTRATVLRLDGRRLLIHSPVALTEELGAAVDALGRVTWLVSPNRVHYAFLAEWQRAWPDALVAGIAAERLWNGTPSRFDLDLDGPGPFPWSPQAVHIVIPGRMVSEAVFHHPASRTLILTDIVQNPERDRICCGWLRVLLALDGVRSDTGGTGYDLRWNFRRDPDALRKAVARIREWAPERVILAHGRSCERDGATWLARVLDWVPR